MTSPNAPRIDLVDDYHGTGVADPYRWLESDNETPQWQQWREQWSQDQAAAYAEARRSWSGESAFAASLKSLMSGGYQGLPTWRGERQFFLRRTADQQFGVLHTVDPDSSERVLLDPMVLDPNGTTTLDGYKPSPDGTKLAYLVSVGGTEESELRMLDVNTGQDIDERIDRCRFSSISWLPDGESFYYVRRLDPAIVPAGEEQFHRRVYYRRLGTPVSSDVEVFGDGRKKTEYFSAGVTLDGRWLTISTSEGTAPRNDLYLAELHDPAHPSLVPVVEGLDAQTSITIRSDDRMFVWTDRDAPRGKILLGNPHTPTPENWRDLIPESDKVLESFGLFDGPAGPDQYLVVQATQHAIGDLTVFASSTGEELFRVESPGLGTIAGPTGKPEGGPDLWFLYTDYTTPPVVYRFNCLERTTAEWARPPGAVQVPEVETSQETFTSADGTTVRIYLIKPKEASTPLPTILYGYGGFAIPLVPAYNPEALAWVQAGGVYAIANLRGGAEEGEQWHRDGMLGKKQNVFADFHAAAEHLISTGTTTTPQLCISGGSNGGLLVGAAVTQRPDLYGAVVCVAPLIDMIRYPTSQLGATWTVEYGDPALPDEFGWLIDYSPYHNVPQAELPATLTVVFDNDTRTDPMHGRKLVAAMQHQQLGKAPVLLRTESDVGHGARAVDTGIAEQAEILAFVAHATGLVIE